MNEIQAIEASLSQAEKALSVLARKVASGDSKGVSAACAEFVKAANKIKSPNQPWAHPEQEPDVLQPEEAPTAKDAGLGLAYDTLQENSTVAGEILATLEETSDQIASLVTAGKRFNADKARMDLHAVSSKVAGILRDVDLTQPWVRDDLTKLAARANQIHSLFFPKS